jgi:hypothetical protein
VDRRQGDAAKGRILRGRSEVDAEYQAVNEEVVQELIPTTGIMQYGAMGVILIVTLAATFRGVPAFRVWLERLLDRFSAEIQKERELCSQLVREEREAASRDRHESLRVIQKNTEAVNKLQDVVQALVDSHK